MGLPRAVALVAGLISLVASQFPPNREGITVLKSKFHENVTISFKEVSYRVNTHPGRTVLRSADCRMPQPGICETTPGVKSYSGYVHLPPGFIDGGDQDYPINT